MVFKKHVLLLSGLLGALLCPVTSEARILCTVITEAESGRVLVQEGECRERVTPASTFKIALAVMGYDAGFLKNENEPLLPFKKGYVEWGGDHWRQPTDPAWWMRYSVVWFSQQIAKSLGAKKLHDYGVKLSYGNADFSGDPGKNNGLDRSWIGSSLKISPLEQVQFLRGLVNRTLPVSPQAQDKAKAIVETFSAIDGTLLQGKTGSAFPRKADGSQDREHSFGWFVGWMKAKNQTLVFVRLIQDEQDLGGATGVRAREALLAEWPGWVQKANLKR